MRIHKFGVALDSLTKKDLPLVLQWRNDPEVSRYMLFQEEISPEAHQAWYESLSVFSYYMMIRWENTPIGVINLRDVDRDGKSAEAGIFIGDQRYLHSFVPMLSILALMDVSFDQLRFTELTARVRKDNVAALRMNEDLGYTLVDMYDDAYHLRVERVDYLKRRKRFERFLEKYHPQEVLFELTQEEVDFFRPVK